MGKYFISAMVLICAIFLSGCANTSGSQQAEPVIDPFPQDIDSAAQYLASHAEENWVVLLPDDGAGNSVFISPRKVTGAGIGINAVWLRVNFVQPIALSQQNPQHVVATLLYTEVRCADNTYRTNTYYAVSEDGLVLAITPNDQAPFVPLDAGAAALSIYHFACER